MEQMPNTNPARANGRFLCGTRPAIAENTTAITAKMMLNPVKNEASPVTNPTTDEALCLFSTGS